MADTPPMQDIDLRNSETAGQDDKKIKIKNSVLKARESFRKVRSGTGAAAVEAKKRGVVLTCYLANSLPDAELVVFSIVLATLFTRAQEASLKHFCKNEGSLSWLVITVCGCAVLTLQYSKTKNLTQTLVSLVIYFLIQIVVNYAPLGCLFDAYPMVAPPGYPKATVNLAIVQSVLMVVLAGLYLFVIVQKNFNWNPKMESQETTADVENGVQT